MDELAPFVRLSGVVGVQRSSSTVDARSGAMPWEALYDTHASDIARYLRRIVGDPNTATDLMQETFVRGMSARTQPPLTEVRPWLFRIASNLAISHLHQPRLGALFGLDRVTTRAPAIEEADQVRRAMRSLPAEQAVTLTLAFHEGFTRREIAASSRAGCDDRNRSRRPAGQGGMASTPRAARALPGRLDTHRSAHGDALCT